MTTVSVIDRNDIRWEIADAGASANSGSDGLVYLTLFGRHFPADAAKKSGELVATTPSWEVRGRFVLTDDGAAQLGKTLLALKKAQGSG